MFTVHATYDNGKLVFAENLPIQRGKVLVTFLDEDAKIENGKQLPTQNLGKILDMERGNLYDEYVSHRY